MTAKHTRMTDGLQKRGNGPFHCHCGKVYKHRQGLHKHKQNCGQGLCSPSSESSPNITSTAFVMQLINQNQEFKDLIIQQNKQLMEQANQHSKSHGEIINKLIEREPTNSTINNTTNNNQKFNLNFFLNETCKDAMNINEFLENIRITFQDLLRIGEDGFVSGLSDIFIKELRELEVNKRPIHCTDSKRETMYLKENNEWNKDDSDNNKLKEIIGKVEYKNVAALRKWCQDNPESNINNTDKNLLRDKIYLQTLQGDDATRDKIIKNISKNVTVDK